MPFLLIVLLAVVFVRLYVACIKKVPPPNPGFPAEQIVIPIVKLMWMFVFFILFFITARAVYLVYVNYIGE